MINVENAIKIAIKTGTIQIGSEKSLRLVKNEQAKLIIIANNCPKDILEDLEIYCKLSNISIYQFKGSSWDLGFLCGKPFMISTLAVVEPGDSDILKLKDSNSN